MLLVAIILFVLGSWLRRNASALAAAHHVHFPAGALVFTRNGDGSNGTGGRG